MKGKKGFEMTLNVVIVAALLLVTMAVLIALYLGGVGRISKWFGEWFNDLDEDKECSAGPGDPDQNGNGIHDTKKTEDGEWCDCEFHNSCPEPSPS